MGAAAAAVGVAWATVIAFRATAWQPVVAVSVLVTGLGVATGIVLRALRRRP